MSFLNSIIPVLRSLRRNLGGTNSNDSEKTRILPNSSITKNRRRRSSDRSATYTETTNITHQQQRTRRNSSSNIQPSTSNLSSVHRKSSSAADEFAIGDSGGGKAYFNASFSPSPSDLERSWEDNNMKSKNGVVAPTVEYNGLKKVKNDCRITLQRDPIDQLYIGEKYGISPTETTSQKASKYFKSRCICNWSCFLSFVTSLFPILTWLPKYRLEYLIPDIISGFTISILHIPQGMAYGILASVKAENGLYVSFFPVLVYVFLGTSRHISIGTFAVISLMLSSSVSNLNAVHTRDFNSSTGDTNFSTIALADYSKEFHWPPTHLEVVTSLAIAVGFWQLFMSIFRLGSLTVVLSDQLISGFTTGAAIHVATSQIKELFGIPMGRYSGPLKLIYMYRDIFENLAVTNAAAVVISAVAIFTLAIVKEQIETRLKGKLKMPIPIDLIVVVLATTTSYLGNFNGKYNVAIMKDIPTGIATGIINRVVCKEILSTRSVGDTKGLSKTHATWLMMPATMPPKPSVFIKYTRTLRPKMISTKFIGAVLPLPVPPRLDLILQLVGDSFAIAVVAFAISLSMAKLFSKKHKYPVRPNQELLALGCANVFSSFFACYPCSASLSRSLVQERAGGKTQVAGVVSCCIILLVLLVLAPLFYSLPKCILSCVILVALKGMFLQVKDLIKAWGISKLDACIWLVTFTSTVILDVSYGLLVGVLFSILTVIFRTALPSRTFLGRIPNTDTYLDIRRYDVAQEVKGVKIFHFESALYFMNKELFRTYLQKHVPLDISDETEVKSTERIHRIIIDCSTFSFVDTSGLETLLEIMRDYKEVGISVFLSGCSIAMHDVMERSQFYENVPQQPSIFPTIHDAVEFHSLPNGITESS